MSKDKRMYDDCGVALNEVKSKLCIYDKRNPNYDDYEKAERPLKCFCDNCFYGRDLIANQLLTFMTK
jgi:hypothetical protein